LLQFAFLCEPFLTLDFAQVSHKWRQIATDEGLWLAVTAGRWRGEDDDSYIKREAMKIMPLRERYYTTKYVLSFARIISKFNLWPLYTWPTTQSRFGKITMINDVTEVRATVMALQVEPGTYEIYLRIKFGKDAKSDSGLCCSVLPVEPHPEEEGTAISTHFYISPYCVFLCRTDEWFIVRSDQNIVIPGTHGPRDMKVVIVGCEGYRNWEIELDYAYIRDVTKSYYNGPYGALPFQDGPVPKRLDMLADDPSDLPRISAAFSV